MPHETELKLLLRRQDLPRLRAHPMLAQPARRERLFNTYVDTPDLTLRAQRVAVRERRVGRRTLLTVKTAGHSSGGLAVRQEWETPTRAGEPDFRALMGEHPLAERLCTLAGRLVPIFRTDFVRHSWTLEHEGAMIELALDQGVIATGSGAHERQEPLLELELELKSGPVDALHSLAIDLALPAAGTEGPGIWLMPSDTSKAQRGMALFEGSPAAPSRPIPVLLTQDMSPLQAFHSTVWACLAPLQANLAQLALKPSAWAQPEFVHQSRVALRRLRTALRLFAPWLPRRFVRHWVRQWGGLARQLGQVRDWDVLATTWLPRLLPEGSQPAPVQAWMARQRKPAHQQAARDLLAPSLGLAILGFARGVLTLPEAPTRRTPRLTRWARRTLADTHRQLREQARHALAAGPEGRHALRLSLKRERYTLECLASLLPADEATSAAKALARAQDVLGWLNDLDTARQLLAAAPAQWRPGVMARIDTLERAQLRRLPTIEESLRDLELFKR